MVKICNNGFNKEMVEEHKDLYDIAYT
ncbi:transcriptional regulator, partial [Staphylococcus devriesei]